MPADAPTILATSGGIVAGERTRWEIGPLTRHAVDLAGVTGRAPKVCYVGTAGGDSAEGIRNAGAYFVDRGPSGAVETPLDVRRVR
jgi:hypothetical protein